jgi:hypothetical protein
MRTLIVGQNTPALGGLPQPLRASPFAEYPYRLPAHLVELIAWSAAEGMVLETLPSERAGEFYAEATRGRSASHPLQVKAGLALLYWPFSTQKNSPNRISQYRPITIFSVSL